MHLITLLKKCCKNPTQFPYHWIFSSVFNCLYPTSSWTPNKAAHTPAVRRAGGQCPGPLDSQARGSRSPPAAGRVGPLPAAPFLANTRERRRPPARPGPAKGRLPRGRAERKTRAPPAFADPGATFAGAGGERAATGAGADRLPRSDRHVRATSQNPGEGG